MPKQQLILYPQNSTGQSNITFTSHFLQHLGNISFNNPLGSSIQVGGQVPLIQALATSPSVIGNFRGYSTDGTATGIVATSTPSVSGGTLTLSQSGSGISSTGIYQTVNTLIPSRFYEVEITRSAVPSGAFIFFGQAGVTHTNGSAPITSISGTTVSTSSSTIFQFQATNTEMLFTLQYAGQTGSSVTITQIKMTDVTPSTISDLEDGSVICDLYKDEPIPLTLSVDDFKNAIEKVQSYSKDFNLPATKKNNKIFNSIFDVQKSIEGTTDFNPYVKTRAILKEDTFTIFEGSLRLIDIITKNGEISYNVNLFSEAISLKEILKDKKIKDLNINELQHDYTITNVQNSWTGVLALTNQLPIDSLANNTGVANATTTNVLKYPFCNWDNQIIFDPSTFNLELELESAFRPFIKCKYILDKIFKEANFTFESSFLNSTKFTDLYMDFNWGSSNAPNDSQHTGQAFVDFGGAGSQTNTTTTFEKIDFNTHNFTNEYGWNNSDQFVAPQDGMFYNISTHIPMLGNWECAIFRNNVQQPQTTQSFATATSGSYVMTGNFALNQNDTLDVRFRKLSGTNAQVLTNIFVFGGMGEITVNLNINAMASGTLLNTLRGELNQFEFIQGLFTKFNLVTLQDKDNPNNLIIEPYKDVFVKPLHVLNTSTTVTPKQLNWTDKVDISEINLKPLELKKETNFSHIIDSEDYAHGVYKKATGKDYGAKIFFKTDYTMIDGDQNIKAEPFGATIVKPLQDFTPDFITPSIFSSNDDATEFESFENSPRILYDNGVKNTGKTYKIFEKNGVGDTSLTTFLQFSHFSTIPVTATTEDYNFGNCPLFPPLLSTVNNLYSIYWQPYYDELYHPDTRIMTLKVNLTASDINTFKFFDTVMIKNKEYRVNRIDYKAGELANVEFILLP